MASLHLDVALGLGVLALLVSSKLAELRARRRSVAVDGVVIEVLPRPRATSYFVQYDWHGAKRIAELRGAAMRRRHEAGDALRVCIDPDNPPDDPLPDATRARATAPIDGGSCTLAGSPLFAWWDALYLAAAIFLIGRGFW